ncbi:MAG: glycosyltransferase [Acidobacteriota bacterium]|nr:glycosyltransferase [Acidobacteriota bacterium]
MFIHNYPGDGGRCVPLLNRLPELGFAVDIITNSHRHSENEQAVRARIDQRIRVHETFAFNRTPFRLLSRFGFRELALWLEKLFVFPDIYILGLPFALLKGWTVVRSNQIDVMMTVSPPESFHLCGWILQKVTSIPWVANFEDLWTDKEHVFSPPTAMHRWFAEIIERKLYRDCRRLIANTQGNWLHYQRAFAVPRGKISVVTLGYDESAAPVDAAARPPTRDRLVLGYMGAFDKAGFPWREFLLAIKRHVASPGAFPIELRLCGEISKKLKMHIASLDLQNYCVCCGLLSHHEAVARMRETDVLVVLMYETPYSWAIMPQKTYHYIGLRKRVIGIGEEEGELNSILRRTGAGNVTPLSQLARLNQQLWSLAEEKRLSGYVAHSPVESETTKYSVGVVSTHLAECLQRCARTPSTTSAVITENQERKQ